MITALLRLGLARDVGNRPRCPDPISATLTAIGRLVGAPRSRGDNKRLDGAVVPPVVHLAEHLVAQIASRTP
jgi:hypothetical protein